MEQPPLKYQLECLVLAADDPLTLERAKHLLGGITLEQLQSIVDELNEENTSQGRSFTVELRGERLVARTRDVFSGLLEDLRAERRRLTPPLLHTLAIVAYRQPVSRAQIDQIRGVDSGYALSKLLHGGLVHIAGRAEKPGRPLLYGTTADFLIRFGLRSLDELPRLEELSDLAGGMTLGSETMSVNDTIGSERAHDE